MGARATKRAQEARVRAIIVQKKEELEASAIRELNKMCTTMGIQGVKAKPDCVRLILQSWQGDGGVEKELARQAREKRIHELQTMDKADLCALCEANDIDHCVTEIMADRIAKAERAVGRFARPTAGKKQEKLEEGKPVDLVDALLANEASRKAEEKKQSEQKEVTNARLKEWASKSVEDLKKLLRKRGVENDGKKDVLLKALFDITLHEEAVNARRAELKAMALPHLKALISENGIECSGSKENMIAVVLDFEAKQRDEIKAFDAKANEVAAQKQEELERKTESTLKDLCTQKDLPVKGGKSDKVERLVAQARVDGEIDACVSATLFRQRFVELRSVGKAELLELCEKFEVDPYVKEVMIERVLSYEDASGIVAEPPKKRKRSGN